MGLGSSRLPKTLFSSDFATITSGAATKASFMHAKLRLSVISATLADISFGNSTFLLSRNVFLQFSLYWILSREGKSKEYFLSNRLGLWRFLPNN
jgi:hypothetical protein